MTDLGMISIANKTVGKMLSHQVVQKFIELMFFWGAKLALSSDPRTRVRITRPNDNTHNTILMAIDKMRIPNAALFSSQHLSLVIHRFDFLLIYVLYNPKR